MPGRERAPAAHQAHFHQRRGSAGQRERGVGPVRQRQGGPSRGHRT